MPEKEETNIVSFAKAKEARMNVLRKAAQKVQEERKESIQLTTKDEEELMEKATNALRIRGFPNRVFEKIDSLSIWSKSYTENNASRLISKDGEVLFEIDTPLTDLELELIDKLGLRK